LSKDQGKFKYINIPCIHKKYQDVHIEDAKAMTASLSLNAKGFITCGLT
jgi:hypothetical protein